VLVPVFATLLITHNAAVMDRYKWYGRPSDIHIFDTQFYGKLQRDGVDGVAVQTCSANIFDKKMVILAVNYDGHYSVVVILSPDALLNDGEAEDDDETLWFPSRLMGG
jgi:hypothetical protein